MRPTRLTLSFLLPALASGLLLLGACGGGGGDGSDGGTGDPVVVPGGPPPTNPPPTNPPPANPPPTNPPPVPPPTNPPPTNPPPTNPPPTTPPPANPPPPVPPPVPPPTAGVPALPTLPAFVGFAHVDGVAVDPQTDTLFAIRSDTGDMLRMAPGDTQPVPVHNVNLRKLRALTFDGSGNVLLTVTDGAAGSDDVLQAVNPTNGEVVSLGTITGYDQVEGLTFHRTGAERKLYAVDTEQDVLLQLNPLNGLPTVVGPLGAAAGAVNALASKSDEGLLLGVDATRGDVLVIDPTTGSARSTIPLALGAVRGLGYAPGAQVFWGVAADDKLHQIDIVGSWIGWDQVKGLAYDTTQAALYGVHTGYGLVVRADPDTGWRQPFAQVQDAGLEGLAYDATGNVLHALSRTTGALFRIRLEDGGVEAGGTVSGAPGGTWRGLASLAFAQGKLYATDSSTASVVEITPATAQGTVFTAVQGHTGLQSLAYDAEQDRLLAHADGTRSLLAIPRVAGSDAEVLEETSFGALGGLAWMPAALRLVGSDLSTPSLTTVLQLVAPGLGFDQVHALALALAGGELTGYDNATGRNLVIDVGTGQANEHGPQMPFVIEGLAHNPLTVTTYAVDAASDSLYEIAQDGTYTRRGPAGALSGVDVRALAFDPTNAPGVLYGFDNAARKLVTIDAATGVPTAVGGAIGPASIEALAWIPGTTTLVAIDRTTRMLMELDQASGQPTPIAAVALNDVRGMVAAVGTDELLVVDATLDRLALVDRFTGDILDAFDEPSAHRGASEAPVVLLWPRGDVRAGQLTSLAVAVDVSFEGGAQLVIRRGTKLLHKAPFRGERVLEVRAFPETVRKLLRTGATVTWGLEFTDQRKAITTTFVIADDKAVRRDLDALSGNEYLRKQKPHVIATRVARALLRHGLAGEALVRAAHAASLEPDYVPAQRALTQAHQALLGKQAQDWSADGLVKLLGEKDGPSKLLGLPAPKGK